jgi:hypothetical protein
MMLMNKHVRRILYYLFYGKNLAFIWKNRGEAQRCSNTIALVMSQHYVIQKEISLYSLCTYDNFVAAVILMAPNSP